MTKHEIEARLEELENDLRRAEDSGNSALADQIMSEIENIVIEHCFPDMTEIKS